MRRALQLLALLADGREHSGTALAETLGVTRAAVWNQVARLRGEGIAIEATAAQGYCLAGGFEALDRGRIQSLLDKDGTHPWRSIAVERVIDSTNEQLLRAFDAADAHGHVMFAEFQTAGRGRRGDAWISPPGSGLCFSVGYRFDMPPTTFSALSLVVGLAAVGVIHETGVRKAALKWPNDIVLDGRKLAGILIEMRSEAGGPCRTVIGMGLNISLSDEARAAIDQPADDLTRALGAAVSRNALAARLLRALGEALPRFEAHGFAPFRDAWLECDALAGRHITLDLGQTQVSGEARGVDDYGALLIDSGSGPERYLSGHISVR